MVVGICNFDVSQIDIAHRESDKGTAPIIVLCNRKTDRTDFSDRRWNCLNSKPTILLNLIMTIIVIVKLVCQALSEKIALSIWTKV